MNHQLYLRLDTLNRQIEFLKHDFLEVVVGQDAFPFIPSRRFMLFLCCL
jgi:hypothetical protein